MEMILAEKSVQISNLFYLVAGLHIQAVLAIFWFWLNISLCLVKIDYIVVLCLLLLMIYMNTPLSEVSFHVSCVPARGLSSCYSP